MRDSGAALESYLFCFLKNYAGLGIPKLDTYTVMMCKYYFADFVTLFKLVATKLRLITNAVTF